MRCEVDVTTNYEESDQTAGMKARLLVGLILSSAYESTVWKHMTHKHQAD